MSMTTTSAKPAKRKKFPQFVRFDTPTDVPPMVAAATVCVGMLRWTGVNSLQEFQDLAADSASQNETFWKKLGLLDLNEEQQALLRAYDPVLKLIRIKPPVNLAVCPECCTREVHGTDGRIAFHGWQAVVGQAPPKCRVTAGCEGKPVKGAAIPKQVKIDRDEDGHAIEPGSQQTAEDPFDDPAGTMADATLFDLDHQPAPADHAGPDAGFEQQLAAAVEHAVSDAAMGIVAGQHAEGQGIHTDEFSASASDFDDEDFGSGDPGDLTDFDFD